MLLPVHSYYSLRYGTLSVPQLLDRLQAAGYESAVLADINNTTGALEFLRHCRDRAFSGGVGVTFRNGEETCFTGVARNAEGFRELNELLSRCHLQGIPYPDQAPEFQHAHVVYPWRGRERPLRGFEYIGVSPQQLTQLWKAKDQSRMIAWNPCAFPDESGLLLHRQLRAIDHNLLLSQLAPHQSAGPAQLIPSRDALRARYAPFPDLLRRSETLMRDSLFAFDFSSRKNRQTFSGDAGTDRTQLERLAFDGAALRYDGDRLQEARKRVRRELGLIEQMSFGAYFLTAWDIVQFANRNDIYHVGRGSGANSVVAYCLGITAVCPIELDLYFERFLNPKRQSPPDFDIDFSWKDRDTIYDYLFKKYPEGHVALLGAMSTFKDRSIVRELGKVYGLPKAEIDRLADHPQDPLNDNEITRMIRTVCGQVKDFPNQRTIHAGGILISERPLACYTALDLPPKGYPTVQLDMYQAEDAGLDKLDLLSQRGIGHIRECAELVQRNQNIPVDVHDVGAFKKDPLVQEQLRSGNTIGCFYIESPAMRGLLRKLRCTDYKTLVAASSIIRPGVAKSGMMRQYIHRFHHPESFDYLHPVMKEQLEETYGVMVFQEDVIKVAHHFGGLDLADADVLRRMMSGKTQHPQRLAAIRDRYYANCASFGYSETLSSEVWRQIESFAGYSFSKAHSASYAVESYQSLYLKSHYPLEFITAVINNFGGFYSTWVYVHEAQRSGADLQLPCVNRSGYFTGIDGRRIFLGLIHIQNLEEAVARGAHAERIRHGDYAGVSDFVRRTGTGLEQLKLLIAVNAFRFTGKDKKALLWEACLLLGKGQPPVSGPALFGEEESLCLPELRSTALEDAYDEIELLGFPVSLSRFDMLQTRFRGGVTARELTQHTGGTVRMLGNYVAVKQLRTARREPMSFGTFIDRDGDFFDTVHFPGSLEKHAFKGHGVYLIEGTVTEEFGFPSVEVGRMEKLGIRPRESQI